MLEIEKTKLLYCLWIPQAFFHQSNQACQRAPVVERIRIGDIVAFPRCSIVVLMHIYEQRQT